MQRQTHSLKRSAPGSEPVQHQQMDSFNGQSGYGQPDGLDWQNNYQLGANFDFAPDASTYVNPAGIPNNTFPQNTSQELVRRNANQNLGPPGSFIWQNGQPPNQDEDEDLRQKALEAKKDAEANKKGIPPFVQKLSSFLDDPNNIDLIRWSDDGEYFLILDEEAFAKNMIPQFWKHKNYASFVRQLNMYGFHKLVGLGDNSMKASESKTKQPSRYKNPYFKRGRPDLLWLIQKTTKQATSNRKGDAKQDDDDQPYPSGVSAGNSLPIPSKRKVEVDEDTLNQIKKEVADLRKQNMLITSVINKLRKQDFAISQQALQFSSEQQRMQQRHQQQLNSLNAITSFLYNIFNNRLEGDPNARASFDNMLRTMLPSAASSGVVEVQDMPTELANYNYNVPINSQARAPSRRPLLLTGPESAQLVPDASGVTELPQTPTTKVEPLTPQGLREDVMTFLNPDHIASTPSTAPTPFDSSNGLGAPSRKPLVNQSQPMPTPSTSQSASTSTPHNALSPRNQHTPFQAPPIPAHPTDSQEHLDFLEKLQSEQSKRVQSLAEKLGPLSPNGQIPGIHDSSNVDPPDEFDFDQWLNNNNDNVYNFDASNFDLPESSSGELFPNAGATSGTDFADFGGNIGPDAAIPNTDATVDGTSGHKRVQSVSSRGASPGSIASPATVETILEGETPADEIATATSSPAPARKRRRNN